MSTTEIIKSDLAKLKERWQSIDKTIRILNIIAILGAITSGIAFVVISSLDFTLTVTNAGLMILPIVLSGYVFVLQSKLQNEEIDNRKATKEFVYLCLLTIGLVLLSVLYTFILRIIPAQ